MAWFAENWFWVLIFIVFIAMHMFGHGGHGGHGGGDRRRSRDEKVKDEEQGRVVNTSLNKDVKWQRNDPGWYSHPKGSVAYEWDGVLPTS
jgi:hypothetical protein